MSTILLLTAFPPTHTLNAAMAEAYRAGASVGVDVDVLDLTSLRFDPVLREGQGLEADLALAQQRIMAASHLTWVCPTYWAGPPAVLKAFIDRTFLPGFAYKNTGKPLPDPLLKGRSSRLITTMDSPSWWYRFWNGRSLHRSLQRATFAYVGLSPRRETTIYTVRELSEGRLLSTRPTAPASSTPKAFATASHRGRFSSYVAQRDPARSSMVAADECDAPRDAAGS